MKDEELKKRKNEIFSLIAKDKFLAAAEKLIALEYTWSKEIFSEWRRNRTKEEKELADQAYHYEEDYFQDMLLNEYKDPYVCSTEMEDETWEEVKANIFSYSHILDTWIFKLEEIDDCCSQCVGARKTITIDPAQISAGEDLDLTLLHELIHAFEFIMPDTHKQYVTLRLFQKLEPLIPGLLDKIEADLHTQSSEHTLLFLLKSLDLDLRLNKPPGTIYSHNIGNPDLL